MAEASTDLRTDIVAFASRLINPETGQPFVLYPAEVLFLRLAFTLTQEGRPPFSELVFSAIKKSGKTTLAALIVLYVVICIGGAYAEAYVLANDLEQAQSRVYEAIVRLVRANPALRKATKITERKIVFLSSGATITALASDYQGAAGAAPCISVFDELSFYSAERASRLFDEMIPVPTRKVSVRLTVTHAGFDGESKLLQSLYERGLRGEEIAPSLFRTSDGMLMFWSHEPIAPWQTPEWVEQMRTQLRPSAFIRMILNRFASGEEQYLPVEWWDHAAWRWPLMNDPALPVWIGVDAGLKRDSAAIAVCAPAYYDDGSTAVALIGHRIFLPTRSDPIDLEDTLEAAVLDYAQRFDVQEARFDPWQFARSAQGLQKAGINMVEFPQSMPNLTRMSANLYELMKGGNLVAYPDPAIRQAIQHAVAIETSRGLKIAKEKASHKIDIVVATAMAALGVVENGGYVFDPDDAATIASASHYTFHLGRTWT